MSGPTREMNVQEVSEYLKDRARIGNPGRAGAEVIVNKNVLALAAVYLDDLLELLGNQNANGGLEE